MNFFPGNSGLKLLKAAESGDINMVESLLSEDGSFLNFQDDDGYTALHRASYEGHIDVIEVSFKVIIFR